MDEVLFINTTDMREAQGKDIQVQVGKEKSFGHLV